MEQTISPYESPLPSPDSSQPSTPSLITLLQAELAQTKQALTSLISDLKSSNQKSIDQLSFQTRAISSQLGQLEPLFQFVEEFEKSAEDGVKSYLMSEVSTKYIDEIYYEIGTALIN